MTTATMDRHDLFDHPHADRHPTGTGPVSTDARTPSDARIANGADVLPCRTTDPDLWFAESPSDVEAAKALCGTCPMRETCLSGALTRREPWGVWGGQLVVDGVVVPRKRPRGRPRKHAA